MFRIPRAIIYIIFRVFLIFCDSVVGNGGGVRSCGDGEVTFMCIEEKKLYYSKMRSNKVLCYKIKSCSLSDHTGKETAKTPSHDIF